MRPLLLARQSCALHSLTLRVLGGESNLEYRVRPLLENPNPTAAIYCKTGECEIRITARAQNDAEAQTMCRAYAKKFYDLLGDAVYDEDVAGLEETVVHTLQANGLTIATAESCTGGMIAQRLTSVSGASEVFGYGFVTSGSRPRRSLSGWTRRSLRNIMWCRLPWRRRWRWARQKPPVRISQSALPVWQAPAAVTLSGLWARCIWALPGETGCM